MNLLATPTITKFKCLQADCPDTCCKGWSMQLDDATYATYKGRDLEDAVAYDGQNNEIRVMKRDPKTDYCVKFTDGICAIHAKHGAELLGDACNFYPRVTRQLGEINIMTATLSCPEISRLALFKNTDRNFIEIETARLPSLLIDYRDPELTPAQMLKIHEAFMLACEADVPAERLMARIYSAAQSLQYIEKKDWEGATPFMIKMADGKLPAPEIDVGDTLRILQIFAAVFHATKKELNPRLAEVIDNIETALGAKINWASLSYDETDSARFSETLRNWIANKKHYNSILKKYIKAQLSFTTFPFAGLGDGAVDKAKLLLFKFILTRLMLIGYAATHNTMDEEKINQAIQSTARIIDHISNPTLIFNLMEQFAWNTDAKLRGLLWDEV